ncbi:hypothetical protein P1J78_18390, partial [Psychromarinibacter sp. C21-152]
MAVVDLTHHCDAPPGRVGRLAADDGALAEVCRRRMTLHDTGIAVGHFHLRRAAERRAAPPLGDCSAIACRQGIS